MTGNEIYELARRRQPAPEVMTPSERQLYTTARNIYKAYSDGTITEQQARKEKRQSIAEFERWANREAVMLEHNKRMVAISQVLLEAQKHGCEYCRKIARIFDGRDNCDNQNATVHD